MFFASSGSTETFANDWTIISTSRTASGSVAMIMSMAITVSGITGYATERGFVAKRFGQR